jgi:hypothetical protein
MINIKDLSIILLRFITYLYKNKHIKFNFNITYHRKLFNFKVFKKYVSICLRKQGMTYLNLSLWVLSFSFHDNFSFPNDSLESTNSSSSYSPFSIDSDSFPNFSPLSIDSGSFPSLSPGNTHDSGYFSDTEENIINLDERLVNLDATEREIFLEITYRQFRLIPSDRQFHLNATNRQFQLDATNRQFHLDATDRLFNYDAPNRSLYLYDINPQSTSSNIFGSPLSTSSNIFGSPESTSTSSS